MATAPYTGYPGQVWATCWQSIYWLNQILANGSVNVATIDDPTTVVVATLRNALNSLAAWQTGVALSLESQNLAAVQAIPLSLDPTTTAYFESRITSVAIAAQQVSLLPTPASPFTAVNLLAAGSPAIADPMYIEWCMQFAGESAPSGWTPSVTPADASVMAQSWLNVANAVSVAEGANLTSVYDTAARMYRCSAFVATNISQLQSGPFTPGSGLPNFEWTQSVGLPAILLDAATLATSPASLVAQQVGAIRYALNVQMQQLSLLLLSLRVHSVTSAATTFVRNTESLMDVANRVSGDFESWRDLVVLNNLQPPFPGPTNQTLALSGQQLFTAGGGIIPDPDAQRPTYANNVLGTDYNFGPINGVQPPWLGDIPLITGLFNFARSIGRRLQTPLGSLVYHSNYGSSIPPEVGAIQSGDEAARLAAYGWSAIMGDPRTGSVLSATASVQPGSVASFAAVVVPIGPSETAVQINEVIGASP